RSYGDWSSDVCSSDLDRFDRDRLGLRADLEPEVRLRDVVHRDLDVTDRRLESLDLRADAVGADRQLRQTESALRVGRRGAGLVRSEERRVGKECRWWE